MLWRMNGIFAGERDLSVQCVAQFPAGTSFRPKKVNSVIFDGILTLRPPKRSVRKTNISAIN